MTTFKGNEIEIGAKVIRLPWPILSTMEVEDKVVVLLDPNAYLKDPTYLSEMKNGKESIKNMIAFNKNGEKIWEAELPEKSDYYYKVLSRTPLIANSFSSYSCEIDIDTGLIRKQEFLK